MPHARIRGYDLSAALALPGVRAIVTGDDFARPPHGRLHQGRAGDRQGQGALRRRDRRRRRRRHRGDRAAGRAPDPGRLRGAARGARPGSGAGARRRRSSTRSSARYFKVFDAGTDGNLCSRTVVPRGRRRRGLGASATSSSKARYQTQAQAHLSLEPCGALAEIDAAGRVTLWSANQSVFRVQANVCESLGLPMTRLRCLTPRVGARLRQQDGSARPADRRAAGDEGAAAGQADPDRARRTSRSVRARHPCTIRMKTGAKRDGTLVAREIELLLDGGAYADDSPGVLGYALLMTLRARTAFRTCTRMAAWPTPTSCASAPSAASAMPQVTFAARDAARRDRATQLGIDPIALRRKNMLRRRRPLVRRPADRCPTASRECLDIGRAGIGLAHAAASRPSAPAGKRRGFGVALYGAYQRPARHGRHRARARGRHGRAQHRRRRHRPGLEHGADADVRRSAASCRWTGSRSPAPTPTARPTIGAPRRAASPTSTGRSVVGAAAEVERQAQGSTRAEMLECAVDDLELLPGGRVGDQGRAAAHR